VSNDSKTVSRTTRAPEREKPFIVQCTTHRCMAYRDAAGKWRDYFNGDEIQGEVKIVYEAAA